MPLRTKKSKIVATLIGIVFVLIALAAIGIRILHTQGFRNWATRQIISRTEHAMGARLEIQKFDLAWSPLTADFYGVTLHGAGFDSSQPLFRAQHIRVVLRLLPLFHHQAQIDQILIEKPELFVRVDTNGKTNLPTFRTASSKSGLQVLVRYAQIHDGTVVYNDLKVPLSADIFGLQAKLRRPSSTNSYQAELSYRNGSFLTRSFRPIQHSLVLDATFTPLEAKIDTLKIGLPHSQLEVQGAFTDYRHPRFEGTYRAGILTNDVAFVLRTGDIPSGEVELTGNLRYGAGSGEASFLHSIYTDGTLQSSLLMARHADTVVPVRQIRCRYILENGRLRVDAVRGNVLSGTLRSDGDIIDLDHNSGNLRVGLANASLREATRDAHLNAAPLRIASKASVQLAINWKDGAKNTILDAKAQFSSEGVPKLPQDIPLDGSVDISYNAAAEKTTIRNSILKTGATQIAVSGTLAKKSTLTVHFNTTDLHELIALASQQGAENLIQRAKLTDLRGQASFDGTVNGTLQAPKMIGRLTANQVDLSGFAFQSIQANLKLDPRSVQVNNATLQSTNGRLQATIDLPLQNWALDHSAPFSADIQTAGISIANIQRVAGIKYPVEGLLTSNLHLNGSLSAPTGSGHLELLSAKIYGESVSSLNADVRAASKTIHVNAKVQAPAGNLNAAVDYTPSSRRYDLKAQLRKLTPSKLSIESPKFSEIQGSISADVTGNGTLDDPQLKGSLESAGIEIHGETISDIQATINVAHKNADIQITSKVGGNQIAAKGNVSLQDEYNSTLSVDTGSIDLGPILRAHFAIGSTASGEVELHATASGPLKTPENMQGHLQMPTLQITGKGATLTNSQPIRIDYEHGVLTVADFTLTAPDTSLSVSGSLPVEKAASMNIHATGNLDFKNLQSWIPGAIASGRLQAQVKLQGTRANPKASGKISVSNVAFSSDSMPIGIESLNGGATLEGKRIRIDKLSGMAGGGKIDLSGTVDLGANPTYALTLAAQSARIHQNGVRAVLDTALNFNGSGASQTLNGRVTIRKLSFEQNSDVDGIVAQFSGDNTVSEPSPFEQRIKLNVSVQSEQEVALTSQQLSVSGAARLQVVGTLAEPVVLGRISLSGGEVFFLGKRFELQNGTIVFANTARTNPIVNLDVATTIEQYNITIHLSGPLDRLKTTYTSDPSLASADIINLLAFGQTTAESQSRSTAPGSLGAESAVASAVGGQVAGQLQKVTGISQLTIDPLAGNNQNPGAQVAIQQRVTGNLLVTFSTDITTAQTQTVQLKYQVKRNITVSILRDENGGYGLDIRYHKSF